MITYMVAAGQLKPGMRLDLSKCQIANMTADGETFDISPYEFEYVFVESVVQETPDCVLVSLSNDEAIGYPPSHEVPWVIEKGDKLYSRVARIKAIGVAHSKGFSEYTGHDKMDCVNVDIPSSFVGMISWRLDSIEPYVDQPLSS